MVLAGPSGRWRLLIADHRETRIPGRCCDGDLRGAVGGIVITDQDAQVRHSVLDFQVIHQVGDPLGLVACRHTHPHHPDDRVGVVCEIGEPSGVHHCQSKIDDGHRRREVADQRDDPCLSRGLLAGAPGRGDWSRLTQARATTRTVTARAMPAIRPVQPVKAAVPGSS